MALKHLFGCRGEGDVWARHGAKGGFSRLFNPVYLFDNKTCTWKRGHGHQYVRKKPQHGGVDIWNYMKTCISFYVFRLLFICLFNNVLIFLYLQCLIYIS